MSHVTEASIFSIGSIVSLPHHPKAIEADRKPPNISNRHSLAAGDTDDFYSPRRAIGLDDVGIR